MSIASQITALTADKTAIASAITAKGGTVLQGDGFDDFATAIASIPSGGGVQIDSGQFTLSDAAVRFSVTHNLGKNPDFGILYPIDVTGTEGNYGFRTQCVLYNLGQNDYAVNLGGGMSVQPLSYGAGASYSATIFAASAQKDNSHYGADTLIRSSTIFEFGRNGRNTADGNLYPGTYGWIVGCVS